MTSCSCSLLKDGAMQPSCGTNMYMSLQLFSAAILVGGGVQYPDSSSQFHSSCKHIARRKSSSSDGGTPAENESLQVAVAVELHLGKLIAYSSSKTSFFEG